MAAESSRANGFTRASIRTSSLRRAAADAAIVVGARSQCETPKLVFAREMVPFSIHPLFPSADESVGHSVLPMPGATPDSNASMTRPYALPEDVSRSPEAGDLEPGTFPFTRGIRPAMYRERLWTMRQYAGYGTAAESNERYKFLLEQGVTGLSV